MLVRLSNGLSERGHHVDLVTPRPDGPLLEEIDPAVRVEPMASHKASHNVPSMIRYLRAASPHVIVASQPHMDVLAVVSRRLAGTAAPVVLRIANRYSAHIQARRGIRGFLLRTATSLTYPMAEAIVGVSDGVSRDIRESLNIPAERVITIYNGIVSEAYWRRLNERLPTSVSHVLRPVPLVVTVGRLVQQKNHVLLLKAFAEAFSDTEAHLLVVGDGPEEKRLLRLRDDLDLNARVTFTGFLENPLPLLKRATVFALSSDHEGLPGVLIEALAAGCEIVATDCPSGPREILEDGRYGRLVPVGDVRGFAIALRDAALGTNRHNTDASLAVARFHRDEMVASYETLFRSLILQAARRGSSAPPTVT